MQLLEDVVGAMVPASDDCISVFMDDGRYGPETLSLVRKDIAAIVGPCGQAQLELSHRLPGLQIADVLANTFFNRAMVTERQARMAAIVAPYLESGQIKLRLLLGDAEGDNQNRE
ncbi:hypothetical protein [Sphingorhabdus sp.]|uniref:hypothetical protein n=1 Tax=Sphingorhabdus sp. TaxID=1902408 RepID=UPI003594928D